LRQFFSLGLERHFQCRVAGFKTRPTGKGEGTVAGG